MKKLIKSYDVPLNLNDMQKQCLQHRLQQLDKLFKTVQDVMNRRLSLIQQQRVYRRCDEVERLKWVCRRYVFLE